MANLRLITNLDFDSATLSSSPACVTNAPVTNLQIGLRAKVARIGTTGPWTISGVYASAKRVSAVSVYKHNFTSLAVLTLKLYRDAALTSQIGSDYTATLGGTLQEFGLAFQPLGWGGSGYKYGGETFESWPASYFTIWLNASVDAVMGFKITITDSGASSYLEAGRIYIGDYWTPAVNASYGAKMGWKEQSRQFRTDGGSLRTEGYEPYRSFSLAFDTLNEEERAEITNTFRRLGLRKDFFMSIYPTEGGEREKDHTAAVKFVSMPDVAAPYFENFTTDIQLEEV
jgi:hypothetical protein